MSRMQDNPTPAPIAHAITVLFREQNRLFGRAVQSMGLSTEQAHLLLVLWLRGPMSMTELGREVALSSGTLSTAIDRMEAADLVRRLPHPDDRRAVLVEPAAWTAAKKKKLVDAVGGAEEALLAP